MKRKIEMRKVADLTPRPDVELNEETVEWIAESLPEEGQREPLVILPGGEVVHGNHRLEAARRAGVAELECVVEAPAATAEEAEARALAENFARQQFDPGDVAASLARMVALRAARIEIEQKRGLTESSSAPIGGSVSKISKRGRVGEGRPVSSMRQAIRDVADAEGKSERTVERAVKKAMPEKLAPRRAPEKTQQVTPPPASPGVDPGPLDGLDRPLGDLAGDYEAVREGFEAADRLLRLAQAELAKVATAAPRWADWISQFKRPLHDTAAALRLEMPFTTCTACKGAGCRACGRRGLVPESSVRTKDGEISELYA